MRITIEEVNGMAEYIAVYVMEEQSRGRTKVTRKMILDAIFAYFGGAR